MIDPYKNFAISRVEPFNFQVLEIEVPASAKSLFPNPATDGAFDVTVWNTTDYELSAEDPHKEIIRITGNTGANTYSILRGRQDTVARNHNLSGKVYKIARTVSAKDIDDINDELATFLKSPLEDDLNAGNNKITNLDAGSDDGDAINKSQLDQALQGIDWQESVLSKENDPPAEPSNGDRYLIGTGTGAWATKDDQIAEWQGEWVFTEPNDGMAIWLEDEDRLKVYNGSAWVTFGSTITHNNLSGRSAEEAHPTSAITGLDTDLGNKLNATDYTPEDDLYTATTVASSATPTPTGGSKRNEYYLTALAAAAEFAAPSGTPANGNMLLIRITDDATARALTWNAIYDGTLADLPSTTTISKTMYLLFIYNSGSVKWELISLGEAE